MNNDCANTTDRHRSQNSKTTQLVTHTTRTHHPFITWDILFTHCVTTLHEIYQHIASRPCLDRIRMETDCYQLQAHSYTENNNSPSTGSNLLSASSSAHMYNTVWNMNNGLLRKIQFILSLPATPKETTIHSPYTINNAITCMHCFAYTHKSKTKRRRKNQLQLIKFLNVIHFAAWGGTHGDNTAAVSDAYNMLAAVWTSLEAWSSLLVPLRPTDPWKCPASVQGRQHRHNTGPKEPCLQKSCGDLKQTRYRQPTFSTPSSQVSEDNPGMRNIKGGTVDCICHLTSHLLSADTLIA